MEVVTDFTCPGMEGKTKFTVASPLPHMNSVYFTLDLKPKYSLRYPQPQNKRDIINNNFHQCSV